MIQTTIHGGDLLQALKSARGLSRDELIGIAGAAIYLAAQTPEPNDAELSDEVREAKRETAIVDAGAAAMLAADLCILVEGGTFVETFGQRLTVNIGADGLGMMRCSTVGDVTPEGRALLSDAFIEGRAEMRRMARRIANGE